MEWTLTLNAKKYFLHSYMPSRKNATNLSELAFIQFSSYPPKWAFTNPPCFVQKLLASSSKYRDCKRKGGESCESSRFGGKKNQITRDITIRECIFKALCSLPFFTPVTYLRSVWFDRQTLATKVLRYKGTRRLQIRFDQSPSTKFKLYNSYDYKVWLCTYEVFIGLKQLKL